MRFAMLSAASLMGVTTAAHVFLGGPEINHPVQMSTLDPVVTATSAVVWHGVSIVLGVMVVALAVLAFRPNAALLVAMTAVQLGFAALFL